jgi:hypothetical protein
VVGARPVQIAHWRALVERCAGELRHHDGGVDDNITGLCGLVSRADLILLPTDCFSHAAMGAAKRLAIPARQAVTADAHRKPRRVHPRAARDSKGPFGLISTSQPARRGSPRVQPTRNCNQS